MSRWKASAIHIGISALVIATLAAILAATWYPPLYAWAIGGLEIIGILASVDVCLGPLLTLIVWNVKKPSLRFDMAVIALVQIMGLSYGLYTLYMVRPVYLVFNKDRFDLVSAVDIPAGELEKASIPEFKTLPLTGPRTIAARSPTDKAERNQVLFSSISGGADVPQLPRYYVPYPELAHEAASKAQILDVLIQRDQDSRQQLSAYLKDHQLNQATTKFLPMRAKAHDQTVLLNGATGEVLGIVNIDPWRR